MYWVSSQFGLSRRVLCVCMYVYVYCVYACVCITMCIVCLCIVCVCVRACVSVCVCIGCLSRSDYVNDKCPQYIADSDKYNILNFLQQAHRNQ